jgi:hypothetical protein
MMNSIYLLIVSPFPYRIVYNGFVGIVALIDRLVNRTSCFVIDSDKVVNAHFSESMAAFENDREPVSRSVGVESDWSRDIVECLSCHKSGVNICHFFIMILIIVSACLLSSHVESAVHL